MKNINNYDDFLNESNKSTNAHRQIFKAARTGDVETVKNLLDLGADIQAVDGEAKETLLHRAAKRGKVEVVKLLLDRGAPIDALDHFEQTPLMHASAGAGHPAVVKLLLNAGANPAANVYGWTALQVTNSTAVANLLLDAGADVNQANNNGETALHLAVVKYVSNKPLIELLLKRGANIDSVDNNGKTPLRKVLELSYIPMNVKLDLIKSLIMHGADPLRAFNGSDGILEFFKGDISWMPEHLKEKINRAIKVKRVFGK